MGKSYQIYIKDLLFSLNINDSALILLKTIIIDPLGVEFTKNIGLERKEKRVLNRYMKGVKY